MHIDGYGFGEIIINGTSFHEDLLIFSDTIDNTWNPEKEHMIHIQDIQNAVKQQPSTFIIGTGYNSKMEIGKDVKNRLKELKIELIIAPTAEAVRHFNKLSEEYEQLAAVFHLS